MMTFAFQYISNFSNSTKCHFFLYMTSYAIIQLLQCQKSNYEEYGWIQINESIAKALELLLSCTKPTIWCYTHCKTMYIFNGAYCIMHQHIFINSSNSVCMIYSCTCTHVVHFMLESIQFIHLAPYQPLYNVTISTQSSVTAEVIITLKNVI